MAAWIDFGVGRRTGVLSLVGGWGGALAAVVCFGLGGPLSADTYRVTFTASQRLMDVLESVTARLSHTIPSGDIAAVLERVLIDAQERIVKRRFGATRRRLKKNSPRKRSKAIRHARRDELSPGTVGKTQPDELSPGAVGETQADELSPGTVGKTRPDELSPGTVGGCGLAASNRTRYIRAEVRGAVYARDGGRCTYGDPLTGRRCGERRFIELHHLRAYALGGKHTVAGLTLRCRAHNLLDARRVFGDEAVDRHLAPI